MWSLLPLCFLLAWVQDGHCAGGGQDQAAAGYSLLPECAEAAAEGDAQPAGSTSPLETGGGGAAKLVSALEMVDNRGVTSLNYIFERVAMQIVEQVAQGSKTQGKRSRVGVLK